MKQGDFLTFVYNDDGTPRVAHARLESEAPFAVLLPSNDWTNRLEPGAHVSLVCKTDHVGAHSDAIVAQVVRYGLSLVVQLENVAWIPFDRRRSPRFTVDLKAEVTLVSDVSGMPHFDRWNASVIDLSSVGCRLVTEPVLEISSLMALTIDTGDEEPLRMLGVVTRQFDEPIGFAIEFFDFVGTTRFRLDSYLEASEQAA